MPKLIPSLADNPCCQPWIDRVAELEAEQERVISTQGEALKIAVRALLEPVLRLWEKDPHQFSTRPCPTCQSISAIVGRPFGCNAFKR